jgi:hypothetical protein|tara:strand:- start:13 stop:450 length:438 start_codon:yes stop_codon:yes gene_type:complete
MAITDSRRLDLVVPYLYPNLVNEPEKDYVLRNNSDGKGTFIVWNNTEVSEPTEQELADAKEDAMNTHWWKVLRRRRDKLLAESDWSQGLDVPENLKASYVTYRNDLRNLPSTVTKPDFNTLNNQTVNEWITGIKASMPSNPKETE